MSPWPRMRVAMRSGWKTSRRSDFSPTPRNLIGLPVTWRTDSAAPPRASPSTLVRITPVNGRRSANARAVLARSEEHTSELQSLMRISYAVFCLKKKNKKQTELQIEDGIYRYMINRHNNTKDRMTKEQKHTTNTE